MAQQASKAGDLRAASESLVLSVAGMGTAAVQVVGTWVGTVSFYVSNTGDAGDYVAVAMVPPNSSTGVTATTANGLWSGSVAGYAFLKVAMSAYTSGVASVLLCASATGGGTGSAGGGGGMQYTEGDTDSSLTGTVFMFEDTGDAPVPVSAAKPLPVAALRPATATLANVSGSASSVTLQASNVDRKGLVIVNDSTAILYVKFGSSASPTSFTYVLGGNATGTSTLELPQAAYTGIVTGIWASATGAARVTELT